MLGTADVQTKLAASIVWSVALIHQDKIEYAYVVVLSSIDGQV